MKNERNEENIDIPIDRRNTIKIDSILISSVCHSLKVVNICLKLTDLKNKNKIN